MTNKRNILLILSFAFSISSFSQTDRIQDLYFVKKSEQPVFTEKDYMPATKGFYIYRNCIYDFVLKNKREISAKVIDIKNDSVYYTLYINENVAQKNKNSQDTFSLHPYSIKRIKLIGDRIMGIYSGPTLTHYTYVFEQNIEPKKFQPNLTTIYSTDSSRSTTYELVPYLTAQGLDLLYEQCGMTYYYEGITNEECIDTSKKELIRKKGIWFSPTNANEVRGVNIGLQTMNAKEQSLNINGVNLNADALSFFVGTMGLFYIPFNNALINLPDTVDTSGIINRIKGLSLSVGGLIGDNEIKGVSINGGIFEAVKTQGIVVTGSQNIIEEFSGVVFSGLRNRSVKGKGVQIGLLNICNHMKGVQIGLWNVNSKRKLPFINWSF